MILYNQKKTLLFASAVFVSVWILSPALYGQRERISSDGSQSVRSKEVAIPATQSNQTHRTTTSAQFKRFKGILLTNNTLGIVSVNSNESLGTVLCRLYYDEFEPKFVDPLFAEKHVRISADEFALAFLLIKTQVVMDKYPDGISLAITRSSVTANGSVRSYEQILSSLFGDKNRAKKAVRDARKELESFVG